MTRTNESDFFAIEWPLSMDQYGPMIEKLKEQRQLKYDDLKRMLAEASAVLARRPNVVNLAIEGDETLTVVGDIHGQFYDLCNIFDVNGGPPGPGRTYLFNGDLVDRGSFSIEVCVAIFFLMICDPSKVHINRGNHESYYCTVDYGFKNECKSKYGLAMYENFMKCFQEIPLAHIIRNKIFVVHGGLFERDVTMDEIQMINRREDPTFGLLGNMLWSDPSSYPGRQGSVRPFCKVFGPDVTRQFLEENELLLLIRSHEMCQNGYLFTHNDLLLTLFSAPNYCSSGNKGAILRLKSDLEYDFLQFECVPSPPAPTYFEGCCVM